MIEISMIVIIQLLLLCNAFAGTIPSTTLSPSSVAADGINTTSTITITRENATRTLRVTQAKKDIIFLPNVDCGPYEQILENVHRGSSPYYIRIHQCQGGNYVHKNSICKMTKSETVTYYSLDLSTGVHKAVEVANHTACGMGCTDDIHCNKYQRWNNSTCACDCTVSERPADCKKWDQLLCRCEDGVTEPSTKILMTEVKAIYVICLIQFILIVILFIALLRYLCTKADISVPQPCHGTELGRMLSKSESVKI